MPEDYSNEPTGWTGWIVFAATMMIIVGGLNAFQGFVALVNDDWVGWNPSTSTALFLDLTQWGWVHLLVGIVVMVAGFGLLTGNVLARVVGVIVSAISLLSNFFFLPANTSLWSLLIVLINVLVIWALTVHGKEMRSFR
jgi:hypothetical protein